MSTRDLLNMALRNLLKRKLRTFLTVLGVVIGTASIVVMVSIGIGMNESFARQLEDWGSLQVINVYSPNGDRGNYYGMEDESQSTKSSQAKQVKLDAAAVEGFRQLAYVEAASPMKEIYLMLGCGKYVADASIIGLEPETMEAMGYKIDNGRALGEEDVKAIVVGGGVEFYDPKLNWEMRRNSEPPQLDLIGEKVEVTYDWNYGTKYADKSVKANKFEVVGTMPADGSNSWSVIMPLKEVEKIDKEQKKWQKDRYGSFSGSSQGQTNEYEQVLVKVNDIKNVQAVQQQIKDMGYRASSLSDELDAMKETTKMLRMVLGAIGAISLVVAAIGITNTMVMAIYERTREIGIMKVIGASLRDIKLLFLTEAAFIGFAGGIVGVGVSFATSNLVNFVAMRQGSDMNSSIPLWLYLGSIGFATVIGILSGYLPAKRAMKLSALSAIKTE
ncbi:macrolide export ATP-binding/permease protein MacB [Anaerotignum neopropionicum]|uniref:Macrolide export ATP-binding/permease protein MacB n=1 Tax=Anaerotignum neopropionicum TaxID=36847 RepID=A0A136WDD7_9FIRM|nr:ABC transporter permease [Anaerotignum neopropionicum]KXL52532.1 macrolide export ATP-binding/permease protein MacB [Anaerotignum neopropionicum]